MRDRSSASGGSHQGGVRKGCELSVQDPIFRFDARFWWLYEAGNSTPEYPTEEAEAGKHPKTSCAALYICTLGVIEEYRGKKIGTTLLSRLLERFVDSHEYRAIYMHTLHGGTGIAPVM